jgi:phospholipid/cholesterol/gamma-HCH transport system substrate-binding protein
MSKLREVFSERRRAALGVAGVVVGSLVATIATSSASDLVGAGQPLTLYADTTDAGALIKGNDVRMYGVKVGVVSELNVVDNDKARLTLDLTSSETPIHEDARLKIRPVSLLGERYVELTPGTPGAPVADDGFTIPLAQTSRAVDLDEVLDAVDQPTGRALSLLLTTMGEGLAGNGKNAADTISELAPSMEQTEELVAVLDGQTATLQRLVDALGPVISSLGVNGGGTTDALIDSAVSLLDATAEQREALEMTLEQLPSTLQTAQRTLASLSDLSDEATPALASARPFTDQLSQIADEATAFSQAAEPAITNLKPVLSKARHLVRQATPLVAQLNSSSDAMVADATNGSRFLMDLSDHLGGILDFITYWSLTTNGEDALSHYFRVQVIANEDTVTSLIPAAPSGGSGGLPGLPEVPGLPDVLDSIPDVPDIVNSLPDVPLLGSLGPLGGGRKDKKSERADPDSATGLTLAQEHALLTMLTGGAA